MAKCALDAHFNLMYVADYVEARIDVPHISKGQQRRIQEIDGGLIKLNGSDGVARLYSPANFYRITRHSSEHRKEEIMLHIAVRIDEMKLDEVAEMIRHASQHNNRIAGSQLMADTSQSALKEKIKAAIGLDPDQRWLILSGNTVAEIDRPKVRFVSA